MQAVRKSVMLFSLGVLGSIAAWAATPEQSYLNSCRKDPGIPVPITVVTPTVDPEYTGSKVDVEFVVDETGIPAKLSIKSDADAALAAAIIDAVKQWRFKPAERDGRPVATKVVLPVMVVDGLDSSVYAAN